jgi:hypothetical protein
MDRHQHVTVRFPDSVQTLPALAETHGAPMFPLLPLLSVARQIALVQAAVAQSR